jgi:hypothetical protein
VLAILRDKTLVDRSVDHNRYIEIELVAGADPQSLLKRVIETGAAIQRFERVQRASGRRRRSPRRCRPDSTAS